MKNFIFTAFLFILFFVPCFQAASQTAHSSESTAVFDTTGFPQWAKDLRRWNIVSFGSYPFAMFFTNFFYDMYRWNNANGMDFTSEGRRYAPWPFRSAGAVEKTNAEFKTSLFLAAGVSAAVGIADYLVVRRKRIKAGMADSAPSGTYIINRIPLNPDENEDTSDMDNMHYSDADESLILKTTPPEGKESFLE